MKCLTCNECSDKEICAKANGFDKAPYPLVSYFKKLCDDPEILQYIKELKAKLDILIDEYVAMRSYGGCSKYTRQDCIEWLNNKSAK